MKKTLAFLLTLMMLFSLGTTAFADTNGSQTITVEVPDSTVITPTVSINLPVVGEAPDSSTFVCWVDGNAEYSNLYTGDSMQITLNGTAFTEDMLYDYGSYVYTFQVSILDNMGGYTFSTEPANVSGITFNEDHTASSTTYTAEQISISDDSRTATYRFTYSVVPSWTLNIPSNQDITYGLTTNPVNLTTSITDVKNMLDTTPIYVHATHTGTFIEITDSSKTIPFTLSDSTTTYVADTPFLVNINKGVSNGSGRYDYMDAGFRNADISITSEAWSAAQPGTYKTVISYSSGLTE